MKEQPSALQVLLDQALQVKLLQAMDLQFSQWLKRQLRNSSD